MDIVVLVVVIYLFLVLTGAARKMGRGTGVPPGRPPRPRPAPPLPRRMADGSDQPAVAQRRVPGSAAEMVPQDLWELLTGQRAPGPPPTPPTRHPPPPAAAPLPYDYDDVAIAEERAGAYDEETSPHRDLASVPNASAQEIRRKREREAREEAASSAAWRTDAAATPGSVPAPRAPAGAGAPAIPAAPDTEHPVPRARLRLAALRRAIIAREILGPPGGLEAGPPRR